VQSGSQSGADNDASCRSNNFFPSKQLVRRAWYVHIFTTSGVVVGMMALEAIFKGQPRAAIAYLLITQLIDGFDGPMARSLDVKAVVPKLDGYVLDLVIDYVTCVVVPAAFIHQFHLLPEHLSLAGAGLVVFLSAMWFSRTDMMTDDHWFHGFPAVWNLVAPALYVMHTPQWLNAIVVVVLSAMMLTNVKFPHMTRALQHRVPTLAVSAIMLGALAYATARKTHSRLATGILVCMFVYFGLLSVWRGRLPSTIDGVPVESHRRFRLGRNRVNNANIADIANNAKNANRLDDAAGVIDSVAPSA
jgi:phosphatidylcholine synthase